MMDEAENRLHQCCFTGHRPEKLQHDEAYYRIALADAIHGAIDRGYRTFIIGKTIAMMGKRKHECPGTNRNEQGTMAQSNLPMVPCCSFVTVQISVI